MDAPEPTYALSYKVDDLKVTQVFPRNGMTVDEAWEQADRVMDQLVIHRAPENGPTVTVNIEHSRDETTWTRPMDGTHAVTDYPPPSCVHCIHAGTGTPGNGTEDSETGWSVCPEHKRTPLTDEVKHTVMTQANASYRLCIDDLPKWQRPDGYTLHIDEDRMREIANEVFEKNMNTVLESIAHDGRQWDGRP